MQALAAVAECALSIVEPYLIGIAAGNGRKHIQIAIAIHIAEGQVVNVNRFGR